MSVCSPPKLFQPSPVLEEAFGIVPWPPTDDRPIEKATMMSNLSADARMVDDIARPASADHAMAGPVFTPLERQVLDLARDDSELVRAEDCSLWGWFRRMSRRSAPQPLANKMLEALRCYAVMALSNEGGMPADATDEILSVGYRPDQIAAIHFILGRPGRSSMGASLHLVEAH